MIWGIGTDIVCVARVGAVAKRWGDRFFRRAYHEAEIDAVKALMGETDGMRVQEFLATRWAVKESVYKALGDRDVQRVARFPEIQLVSGSPGDRVPVTVKLSGETKSASRKAGIGHIHVSTSHDGGYAIAYVTIERATK